MSQESCGATLNMEQGEKLVLFQLSGNKAWAVYIVLQINLLNLLNCKFSGALEHQLFKLSTNLDAHIQPGNTALCLESRRQINLQNNVKGLGFSLSGNSRT